MTDTKREFITRSTGEEACSLCERTIPEGVVMLHMFNLDKAAELNLCVFCIEQTMRRMNRFLMRPPSAVV